MAIYEKSSHFSYWSTKVYSCQNLWVCYTPSIVWKGQKMTAQGCDRQIAIFTAKKRALEIVEELKKTENFLCNAGFDTFDLQRYIMSLNFEIDEVVA